jgi:hypothetical protein
MKMNALKFPTFAMLATQGANPTGGNPVIRRCLAKIHFCRNLFEVRKGIAKLRLSERWGVDEGFSALEEEARRDVTIVHGGGFAQCLDLGFRPA